MTSQTSGGFLGDLEEAFTPPAAGGCCGSPSSAGEPSDVALYATPVLAWRGTGQTQHLEHRRDFVEHLASAELPHPRTALLTTVPETDSGTGSETGLRGRWVLADATTWGRACELAEAQGAAGVLTVRGTDADGWMPKMIAGPPARAVPLIAVRPEVHGHLAEALHGGPVR